jgi:hypothetical protein
MPSGLPCETCRLGPLEKCYKNGGAECQVYDQVQYFMKLFPQGSEAITTDTAKDIKVMEG